MTGKQFAQRAVIPAIIVLGTLLLLLMFLPGLRPGSAPEVKTVDGKSAIGGAFNLVDQRNQPVTSDSLKGKYSLVYFGFTNCPDICPISLQTMTQAMEIAGPFGENVVPIFITVDAERDTPQVMAGLCGKFSPALSGADGQRRTTASGRRCLPRLFQKGAGRST